MISDEELECMASTEAQNSTVAVVRTVAEMAQELLAYREADRAIWENAPEWANWFARDEDGMERFFAKKPLPSEWGWVLSEDDQDSLHAPRLTDNWQSTLQERPK